MRQRTVDQLVVLLNSMENKVKYVAGGRLSAALEGQVCRKRLSEVHLSRGLPA
jgi:hypothetical protein